MTQSASAPPAATRILVRPGGLGDTLLLAPTLEILAQNATTQVQLAGYPNRLQPLIRAGLASGIRDLDAWLTAPRTPGFQITRVDSFFATLPGELPDSTQVCVHPPFPAPGSPVHVARHIAECLGVVLPAQPTSPLKGLLQSRSRSAGRITWLHPGAGSRDKRWPLEKFLSLHRELLGCGECAVFLIGEAEGDLAQGLMEGGCPVAFPDSVMELAGLFALEDTFVGNDSGPTHLAALCGLRTLAIFGPTLPEQWAPWGEDALVVRNPDGEGWPEVGEVLASLVETACRVG